MMRTLRRQPKTPPLTMADKITATGRPPSRPAPNSRASRRAARRAATKPFASIKPNMRNLSGPGLPYPSRMRKPPTSSGVQQAPAQPSRMASMVRKALNASRIVQSPTSSGVQQTPAQPSRNASMARNSPTSSGVQNTSTAGQMMRQGGRLIGQGMRQGTASAMTGVSRGVADAGRQVNVQLSKTVARRFENRPMTAMGAIVRLLCFILFCTLTVRFLWVGVPSTLWIVLVVWGLLMFVYFYQRMDLCVKPV
jgi:hypothetical protein